MVAIQHPLLLAGSSLFFIAAGFMWRLFRDDDTSFGEFSVGFTHRDLYGFLVIVVPLIAGFSYLLMSMGLGSITVDGRTFFWLRYFEWSITTPLLVLGVVMLTQAGKLTADAMMLDYVMIVTGLLAAVSPAPYRFLALGASMLAYLGLVYILVNAAKEKAMERPEPTRDLFIRLQSLLLMLWTAYPFIWMLSTDGFALLTSTTSHRVFLVLDLCAKIGFAYLVSSSFRSVHQLDVDLDLGED